MQLYTVLIVDGDERQAHHLEELLRSSSHASELQVSLCCNGDDLRAYLAKTPSLMVDILFVGIELKDGETISGPELVRRFFADSERLAVVYLAKSLEQVPGAYDTRHVFTLPVPVTLKHLEKALEKACQGRDAQRAGDGLVIRSGGSILRLPAKSVRYIESLGHKMIIHAADGSDHSIYGSLRSLQEILPASFARIHKSYLVNMEHVATLGRSALTLDDGSIIPLSRNYRASFKNAYIQFFDERE